MIDEKLLRQKINEKEKFQVEFEALIQDKETPLEKRWHLFEIAVGNDLYVKVDSYVLHLNTLESKKGFSWYDNFYYDRYKTVNLVEVVYNLETYLAEIAEPECNWATPEKAILKTQEEIDALKEEILQTGYSAFVYDW